MAARVASPTQSPAASLLAVLVEQGILTQDQAGQFAGATELPVLEDYLTSHGVLSADDLLQVYAKMYGVPFIRIKKNSVTSDIVRLIPEILARRYDIAAYDLSNDLLYVAMASPSRFKSKGQGGLLQRLQADLGRKVALSFAPLADIRALYSLYSENQANQSFGVSIDTSRPQPAPTATQAPVEVAGMPTVTLAGQAIDPLVLNRFPLEIAQKYKVIPFAEPAVGQLQVAILPPMTTDTQLLIDFVERHNNIKVQVFATDEVSYNAGIAQYHAIAQSSELPGEGRINSGPIAPPIPDALPVTVQPPAEPSQPVSAIASEVAAPSVPVIQAPVAPTTVATQPPIQSSAPPATDNIPINLTQAVEVKPEEIRIVSDKPTNLQIQTARPGTAPTAPVTLSTPAAEAALDTFLGQDILSINDLVVIVKSGNVPKMVAAALALAINMRASDVHIEANREQLRLRYRIDGELSDVLLLPISLLAPIVSRVKILSELKIDENRIPQDGRFDVRFKNRDIDLRVSTLPTVHGEKLVMRILDKSSGIMTLEAMGIQGTSMTRLRESINKPYGIILATGPTGSGKSTTLYAALQEISRPNINIVTLEDPVEYEVKGINQTQIKPKIGFTFAEGLRSILRQDPNVIMVGEIRDRETAEMATHAALTGHLVLSTLHTNTAAGALPRLINMGIEPFLITSSINAVVGQRLVRRLCEKCRAEEKLPEAVLQEIEKELNQPMIPEQFRNVAAMKFFTAKGCSECTNGYRGRVGIFEVLSMSETIEALAVKKEPESVMQEAAVQEGMITMRQDGLIKALQGFTSVEEVMKAATG